MLDYTYPSWSFGTIHDNGKLIIENTKELAGVVGFGYSAGYNYGSKIYFQYKDGSVGVVSNLPINNPDYPNVEIGLIPILNLHLKALVLKSIPGDSIGVRSLIATIETLLRWLGEERRVREREYIRVPFDNGAWEIKLPMGTDSLSYNNLVAHRTDIKYVAIAKQAGEIKLINSKYLSVLYEDGTEYTFGLEYKETDLRVGDKFEANAVLAFSSLYFYRDLYNKHEVIYHGAGIYKVKAYRALLDSGLIETRFDVQHSPYTDGEKCWNETTSTHSVKSLDCPPITPNYAFDVIHGNNKPEV